MPGWVAALVSHVSLERFDQERDTLISGCLVDAKLEAQVSQTNGLISKIVAEHHALAILDCSVGVLSPEPPSDPMLILTGESQDVDRASALVGRVDPSKAVIIERQEQESRLRFERIYSHALLGADESHCTFGLLNVSTNDVLTILIDVEPPGQSSPDPLLCSSLDHLLRLPISPDGWVVTPQGRYLPSGINDLLRELSSP